MPIFTKTNDGWTEIGASESSEPGLPGVGGWATITGVTGTYTQPRYEYEDADGVEWVAYEWTGDGSVTTSGGLVDALVVSGGGVNSNTNAFAGQVHEGLRVAKAAAYNIEVGSGGNPAHGSSVWDPKDSGQRWIIASTLSGYGSGNWGTANSGPNAREGIFSSITGTEIEYAGGAGRLLGTPGSAAQSPPEPLASFAGIVVIRVPKEYAQNVQETFHGWDSFALVTDGVVTEVTKVPDNEPHTLDAEWVACSSEVSVGWVLVDGDFYSPDEVPEPDAPVGALFSRTYTWNGDVTTGPGLIFPSTAYISLNQEDALVWQENVEEGVDILCELIPEGGKPGFRRRYSNMYYYIPAPVNSVCKLKFRDSCDGDLPGYKDRSYIVTAYPAGQIPDDETLDAASAKAAAVEARESVKTKRKKK